MARSTCQILTSSIVASEAASLWPVALTRVMDRVWPGKRPPSPLTVTSVPITISELIEGLVILTDGPSGRKTGVGVWVAKTAVAVGRGVTVGFGVRVGGRAGVLVAAEVGGRAVGSRVGTTSIGWQPIRKRMIIIEDKKIVLFIPKLYRLFAICRMFGFNRGEIVGNW